jgi:ribonuclease/clavin/mitogillin
VTPISLHAGNPGPMTGTGNWTYLVPGASPVLVDAGVGRPAHLDAIARHAPAGLAAVLVTHAHPDHASGAPAVAARSPRARFSKWPWPERDAAVPVAWHALADGDRIATADGTLEAIHTPGHSPDHVVFWHADSATVFTGDLLVLGGTVVVPASHGGSLADYLRSLERVAALSPRRALPAHGPPIDDPRGLIGEYVVHRQQREAQVLEVLTAGPSTVEAIAAAIYRGLPTALVPQSHETVLAHLVKLAGEGRAVHDPGGWRRR